MRPCLSAKTTGSRVSSPHHQSPATQPLIQGCSGVHHAAARYGLGLRIRLRLRSAAASGSGFGSSSALAPASVLPRDLILDSEPGSGQSTQVLVAQASALSPGHSLHRHRQAVRHPIPSLDLLQAPAMHHLPSRPASRKAGSNRLASAVLGHSPADRDHSFSSSHLSATRVLLIRVSINTSRGRNSNSNSHHSGTDQDPSPHGHQPGGPWTQDEDRQCPDPFEAVEAVVLRDLAGHCVKRGWGHQPARTDGRKSHLAGASGNHAYQPRPRPRPFANKSTTFNTQPAATPSALVASRLHKLPQLLLPSAPLAPLRLPQLQLPNPHQLLVSDRRVLLPLAYRQAMALVKALLHLDLLQPTPPLAPITIRSAAGSRSCLGLCFWRELVLFRFRLDLLFRHLEAAQIQQRSAQHLPQLKPNLLLPPLPLRRRLRLLQLRRPPLLLLLPTLHPRAPSPTSSEKTAPALRRQLKGPARHCQVPISEARARKMRMSCARSVSRKLPKWAIASSR